MKQNKQGLAIWILGALLLIAVIYVVVDKYNDSRQQELLEKQNEQFQVYQQGIQVGYQQAILQVMQQLTTCDAVPLIAGNATINAIAVECLQAG